MDQSRTMNNEQMLVATAEQTERAADPRWIRPWLGAEGVATLAAGS